MKRFFVFFLLGLLSLPSWAQMAEWLIPPVYDEMYVAEGTNFIVTDSLHLSRSIWSFNGVRLSSADCDINAFRNGFAVCTSRGTDEFLGLISSDGRYIPVGDRKTVLCTTYDYPFFSCGYALVYNPATKFYQFVDGKGRIDDRIFVNAFPFMNGFASCRYLSNPEKNKEFCCVLLNRKLSAISFMFNGKLIDPMDIDFISSVNEEGVAVLISKKKLFLYNANKAELTAVCPSMNEENPRKQVRLQGNAPQIAVGKEGAIIEAHQGRDGVVTVTLNRFAAPVSIQYIDGNKEYKTVKKEVEPLTSLYRMTRDEQYYGIRWSDVIVLPPQFDKEPFCFDDYAIVCLSGEYGLLRLYLDRQFQITMFKGKDIPFKHQTFETTIRLDLPKFIPAEKATLEIDPSAGCEIDKTSEEMKNTQYGNFVQYDCTLHIPSFLPDDETIELLYPTTVYYNDLISPVIPLKVKAWHYKYFVVDIIDSETVMDGGALSFTFNINAQRDLGEPVYHTVVNVVGDQLDFNIEKLSEARYKVKVANLKEGSNSIAVQVIEQGCPPVPFPFEITYTKPVAETKEQPAVEEEVVIKKMETSTAKRAKPAPHVEM